MQISQAMLLGKALLKSAVLFARCSFFFDGLTSHVVQSITLVVLVGIGYAAYGILKAKATADESFWPYRVVVWPKFDDLLVDFKLLKDVEEANALYELWKKKDQRMISFTVLQLRPSGDWLIYSNTDDCFLSEIDLEEPIEAIAFRSVLDRDEGPPVVLRDPTVPRGRHFHTSPIFYFREGRGGYELGLKVKDDWWKKIVLKIQPSFQIRKFVPTILSVRRD